MNLKTVFVHFRLLAVLLLVSALVLGDENQPTSQSKSEIEISPPSNSGRSPITCEAVTRNGAWCFANYAS